jgi:hypothetical protein
MEGFLKILDIAAKLNVPGLVIQGVDFITEVKAAADRARHVLSAGEQSELDAIHTQALSAADSLDAKLAAAEKR